MDLCNPFCYNARVGYFDKPEFESELICMKLIKLRDEDINEFKKLMISAFQYGYESFCGKCKEQILPEKDIDDDLNKKDTFAYEMIDNNEIVGGAIVSINEETNHNYLDFLFVKVGVQGKGIGKKIWDEIEKFYPNTTIWATCTPYFDKRNIHFYVNKLKFKIVEYSNKPEDNEEDQSEMFFDDGGMFEFEKEMNK